MRIIQSTIIIDEKLPDIMVQFKADNNVTVWDDLSREEQIAALNAMAGTCSLFSKNIKKP